MMSTGFETLPTVTTLLTDVEVPTGIVALNVSGAIESWARPGREKAVNIAAAPKR